MAKDDIIICPYCSKEIVFCPECKKPIEKDAAKCPHCEEYLARY